MLSDAPGKDDQQGPRHDSQEGCGVPPSLISLICTPSPRKNKIQKLLAQGIANSTRDTSLTPPKVTNPERPVPVAAAIAPAFTQASSSDDDEEDDEDGEDSQASYDSENTESCQSRESGSSDDGPSIAAQSTGESTVSTVSTMTYTCAYGRPMPAPFRDQDGQGGPEDPDFDDLGLWVCDYCGSRSSENCCVACMVESIVLPSDFNVLINVDDSGDFADGEGTTGGEQGEKWLWLQHVWDSSFEGFDAFDALWPSSSQAWWCTMGSMAEQVRQWKIKDFHVACLLSVLKSRIVIDVIDVIVSIFSMWCSWTKCRWVSSEWPLIQNIDVSGAFPCQVWRRMQKVNLRW